MRAAVSRSPAPFMSRSTASTEGSPSKSKDALATAFASATFRTCFAAIVAVRTLQYARCDAADTDLASTSLRKVARSEKASTALEAWPWQLSIAEASEYSK